MGMNNEISERYFRTVAAAEGPDGIARVREMLTAGFRLSQNGGPEQDADMSMAMIPAIRSVMSGFRYENPVRSDTEDGFVEEHDAVGTLSDGTEVRAQVCVVGAVADGKIANMREYVDSAGIEPVMKALGM